jgi:hypothetical protein
MGKFKTLILAGVVSTTIFTGCFSHTNSLEITKLKKTNTIAYNYLEDVTSWIRIDTKSPNYNKWKMENFKPNKALTIKKVNKCINISDGIKDTISSGRQTGLNTFKKCISNYSYLNGYTISYYKDVNVNGFIAIMYDGQKHWSSSYVDDYVWFNVGVIESGTTAELFSDYHWRWATSEGDSRYSIRTWFHNLHKKDIILVKRLKKSLDKYHIKYTSIPQDDNYNRKYKIRQIFKK